MGHLDLVLGSQTCQNMACYHDNSWQIRARIIKSSPNVHLGNTEIKFAKWVTLTQFWDQRGHKYFTNCLIMITLVKLKKGSANLYSRDVLGWYRTSLQNRSPWPSFGVTGVTVTIITLDRLERGSSNLHPSCILGRCRKCLQNGSYWPSFRVSGVTNISQIALSSW